MSRKVIDLYLDLPTGDDLHLNRLSQYCLGNGPKARDGYRRFFQGAEAKAIGFTLEELDKIVAEQGEEEFKRVVTERAKQYNITMDEFMVQLDELGVEWGFTGTHDRNNQRTAEIVGRKDKRTPDKPCLSHTRIGGNYRESGGDSRAYGL